jgi:hypothetical protein
MLFVILFGLSMDYADAVEHGIKTTAGTVTSAAVAASV